MNYKTILFISILFLTISCGGGGGGSYSSNNSVSSASSTPALANLNSGNACKKAWYTTTFPDPTSTNAVFNNYTFFWQDTSFKDTKICFNYYEVTDTIISTGGVSWKDYIEELINYSKRTLGQIVPLNVFILGANPQNNVTPAEKATYNTDFATVQAPVGNSYNAALANYDGFPISSAGGGYSHEAAPNGADIQIPQSLVWGATYENDSERIAGSLKIIAHEYFHVYQNSIKFYNEATKSISLPKSWFSTPSLINSPTVPAYFPWWIEEGGADFGGIVLSAKYSNFKTIAVNAVQQFQEHFEEAHDYFAANALHTLNNFNLPVAETDPPTRDYAYEVGTAAFLYLWYKDPRNFNAVMSKYYTDWQEAELARSANGWQDAFEDAFFNGNGDDYYTLDLFVAEFNNWIRSDNKTNLWNVIAKDVNEIVHADIVPTTPNTEPVPYDNSVLANAKVVGSGTGNRYFIDAVQQKTLVVEAGKTYQFSYPGAHPFKFSTTNNGTWGPDGTSGTADDGTEYTTEVTSGPGAGEVQIVMPNSSSLTTLYYYCSAHPNMGGKILIKNQTVTSSGGGLGGGGLGGGGGSGY